MQIILRRALSQKSIKIAIGAIVLSCFLPFGESLHSGFWSAFSDGIHVPLFFVLVLLANLGLLPIWPRLAARLLFLFGAALIGAIAIEIIQPFFGRSGSVVDIQNGLIGTTLALVSIIIWGQGGGTNIHRSAVAGFLTALLAGHMFAFYPAFEYWKLERLQEERFPVLGGLGSELELLAWEPYGGAASSYNGRIELELGGGKRFSGAELTPPGLSWRRYDRLTINVTSPPEGITLWIRIDDDGICEEFDDRFTKEFKLKPGAEQIEIPLTEIENQPAKRRLNLDSIKRVLLYAAPGSTPESSKVKITVHSISLAR